MPANGKDVTKVFEHELWQQSQLLKSNLNGSGRMESNRVSGICSPLRLQDQRARTLRVGQPQPSKHHTNKMYYFIMIIILLLLSVLVVEF